MTAHDPLCPTKIPIVKPALQVECPECAQVIAVPLTLSIGNPVDGDLPIEVEADTADLWLHAWTHAEEQP